MLYPFLKPSEPFSRDVHQKIRLEAVGAFTAALFDSNETGCFENTQVTGRGRPAVRKPLGDLACGHPAVVTSKSEKDLPPRAMRKRGEHCIHGGGVFSRTGIFRRHPESKILATRLIKNNFYFS
jgi:hypothetical protein